MNNIQKTALIELADKKLLRYLNRLSTLESLESRQGPVSIKEKNRNQINDQTKLKAEIIDIKREIHKLRYIIDSLLDDGFGHCVSCGALISFQRLMLNPSIKTCASCN